MKLSAALIVGLFISAFGVGCSNQPTVVGGGTPPGGPTLAPDVTVISATPGDTSAVVGTIDPGMCVGPTHIMEFNNLHIIIRPKSSPTTVTYSQTQTLFWSSVVTQVGGGHFPNTGADMYDPSCYYDPLSQRWFLAQNDNEGGGGIYIAVSATSDPTGTWRGFVDNPPQINDLEPLVSADRNGMYLCAFDGTGSVPTGAQFCDAFPIADMQWSGAGYPLTSHLNRLSGFQIASRIAADTNASKSSSAYFVVIGRSGGAQNCANAPSPCTWGWLYSLGQWSGTTASIVGGTNQALSSSMQWYSPPSSGGVAQPGAGNEVRVAESHTCGNAYATNASSSFFIACGEGISSTHMGVFWEQINPTTPTVIQSGMLAPVDGNSNPIDAIFPAVAVDGSGNAAITYTGVSSTIYPSTYATVHLSSDTLGMFRTPAQIYPGTTSYTANNPANWGVYGASAVDPLDGTLWGYNQVGLSAPNLTTGIVHFSVSGP